MESSIHCDSVSEHVNTALDLKHSYVNNKHCVHSESDLVGDSVVMELENALRETLLVQDAQEPISHLLSLTEVEPISCFSSSMEVEGTCYQGKGKPCQTYTDEQADCMTKKVLSKCATFPCSQSSFYPATLDEMGEMSEMAMALPEHCSVKSENPACTCSISLPTPLKLVSAMKGSREKQGIHLKKLNVTWATDVYDPPTTSVSHAVKSQSQQRFGSRTNRKNSKNKHKKKSSRAGNSDKQQQHRKQHASSSLVPPKPLASIRDKTVMGGDLHGSTVELVDFTGQQESKCGSSFLRTTLGRVHISVAEAT